MSFQRQCARLCHSASLAHPRIIFSGIQPTGMPHLGNYFGFIQPFVELQENEPSDVQMLLSVVDQHAISLGPKFPEELRSNTRRMTAALIASGVDPERTLLFRQSDVPEIAQLTWILGSLQTVTKLQRLPQYKDKATKFSRGEVPVGLLTYPVLQAADVLTFKGSHVPVGEDQSQHMNLLADLSYAFNKTFDVDCFPIPQQMTRKVNARVRSLRDPLKKMSKSEASERSRIDLSDPKQLIAEKCKKAVSDSIKEVTYDPSERPAVSNLVDLYSAVTSLTPTEVVEQAKDWNVGQLKIELAQRIDEMLSPIRLKIEYYEKNPQEIDELLFLNGKKASEIGRRNLEEVKKVIGFL